MARLFCFDPATGKVTNLGGAASVIERRRYGYVFGDAVTGRDGEIVFGEDDNGGHLWLYFPRIISRTYIQGQESGIRSQESEARDGAFHLNPESRIPMLIPYLAPYYDRSSQWTVADS